MGRRKKCYISGKKELDNKVKQIQEKIDHFSERTGETLNDLKINLSIAQEEEGLIKNKLLNIERVISGNKQAMDDVETSINTLNNTKSTVVTADFSGQVKVDNKGKNDSSVPLITLYSKQHVVKVSVTEYDIAKISEGQKVKLSYMNQDKVVDGRIQKISLVPEEDSANISSYEITVCTDAEIPLGYSVQVQILQETVYIPENALVREQNNYYVYQYVDGKAVKKEVTAEVLDRKARIIDGLHIGDVIVVNPEGLKDQMEVKVS